MNQSPPTGHLPPKLRKIAINHWQTFAASQPERSQKCLTASKTWLQGLMSLWACSQFAAKLCATQPDALDEIQESATLARGLSRKHFERRLKRLISELGACDENLLCQNLRRFRNACMLRILWRDLVMRAPLEEIIAELSALAEACVDISLDWHHQKLCAEWGAPHNAAGEEVRMSVLALGKLGGGELNTSSDIDLIFCYSKQGQTAPLSGKKTRSNQEFFIRLGQQLIQTLNKRTAEGFVFRVDMRLRPYGTDGAIAMSFDALEQYYQQHGRDWERYALIKARPIAGDQEAAGALLETLRGFIYRRYLDFSAIESVRRMRALIEREADEQAKKNDLKLSVGGIRMIEFIVQTMQLIYGGRRAALRQNNFLKALQASGRLRIISSADLAKLERNYRLLRAMEHALQSWNDEQTQLLPSDEAPRAALAWRLDCDSWGTLSELLEARKNETHNIFKALVAGPENAAASLWRSAWDLADSQPENLKALIEAKFDNAPDTWSHLSALRRSAKLHALPAIESERLSSFMPLLLEGATKTAAPSLLIANCLPIVEAVLRRTAYLVLLEENPAALKYLLNLCLASKWIAQELTRMPLLLDELLDARALYAPADTNAWRAELAEMLKVMRGEQELEAQMDALRQFKTSRTLNIAARQTSGRLDAASSGNELATLAEVCLNAALELTIEGLVARYGAPSLDETISSEHGFLIVAYGKLGSSELGYRSDLDIAFIYAARPEAQTQGSSPIDNATFFTRLGQRFIHLLNARTRHGQLYSIDTRLRPSGHSGPLVSTLGSFAEYQRQNAWSWEHQALVRARPLCGDSRLSAEFSALRQEILRRRRDPQQLRAEVCEMREKMRVAQATTDDMDQLKHGPGGIVDIEFVIQYLVLAHACDHPELSSDSNSLELITLLKKCGALRAADADQLASSWQTLRTVAMNSALGAKTDLKKTQQATEAVSDIWRRLLEAPVAGAAATEKTT